MAFAYVRIGGGDIWRFRIKYRAIWRCGTNNEDAGVSASRTGVLEALITNDGGSPVLASCMGVVGVTEISITVLTGASRTNIGVGRLISNVEVVRATEVSGVGRFGALYDVEWLGVVE